MQNSRSMIFARFVKMAKKVMNPKTSLRILRGLLKKAIAIYPGVAFFMAGLSKKTEPSL